MYDSLGSLSTPREFFDRLRAAGIHVRAFNPFSPMSPYSSLNERDHRKILVADGQLAIIGGVNLSTDYQSSTGSGSAPAARAPGHSVAPPPANPRARALPHEPWHDTDLQIEGPAVRELKRLFDGTGIQQGGTQAELAREDAELQPERR